MCVCVNCVRRCAMHKFINSDNLKYHQINIAQNELILAGKQNISSHQKCTSNEEFGLISVAKFLFRKLH